MALRLGVSGRHTSDIKDTPSAEGSSRPMLGQGVPVAPSSSRRQGRLFSRMATLPDWATAMRNASTVSSKEIGRLARLAPAAGAAR